MNADQIKNGMRVYCGKSMGIVLHKQGALAVKVKTERTKSFQDFATRKVTTAVCVVVECWGIKNCTVEPPVENGIEQEVAP